MPIYTLRFLPNEHAAGRDFTIEAETPAGAMSLVENQPERQDFELWMDAEKLCTMQSTHAGVWRLSR